MSVLLETNPSVTYTHAGSRTQTRMRSLHCRIGAFHISLHSELGELLEDFARLYPDRIPEPQPGERVIRMEVRKAGRSRLGSSLYQIYGDGKELGGPRRRNEVFPFVEWGINSRVIARGSRYLQIHAATMAHSGQAFVFAGSSGSGKSTLAAGLLSRGWEYLCDEFAMIDPDTSRVHSFPRALCIKAGSFDVIKHLKLPFARRRDYVKGLKGRVGYINPHEMGPHAIAETTPVRFIIFPKYAEGAKPRLHPISRAQALFDLAGCALNRNIFEGQGLGILANVVRGASCFRLESGAINATCELVESLLPQTQTATESGEYRTAAKPHGRVHGDARKPHALRSRRSFLHGAARMAYAVPVVAMLKPSEAFGAGSGVQSCYPAGHACPGLEPCCGGLTCQAGTCQEPCQAAGQLCFVDSDCCSADCRLGSCQ